MSTAAPNSSDDFTEKAKKNIARRSGHRCAICGCLTDGPTIDPNDAVSMGDAAHITAASPRGPRYNPDLTTAQRSSPENGLWACKNHHWTIDHDKSRYSVPELEQIKARTEKQAEKLYGIPAEQGPDLDAAAVAARAASERQIAQWRAKYRFEQAETIELDFREASQENASGVTWSLAKVGAALAQGHKLVLAGRPGAGKTVTLIQLAERLSANAAGPIPLIFSVSGWVGSNRDLAAYVSAQLTDQGVSPAGVALLFATGRLAILLNGWNEAPDADQVRASEQLHDFLLNHAMTGLVLSTRATRQAPTLVGESVLEVLPLSLSKKESIVRAAGLSNPDALLREIAHSTVLAEVTQTPLFLAAAIKLARAGRPIPKTRSGLLESFLADLETTDNHASRLRTRPCQDCHYRFQTALAVAMTREGQTALATDRAQAVIAECSAVLVAAGRIEPVGATAVAESLAQHHALVYLPEEGPGYGFIHQQFQEWFVSRWLLDELRRLSARPDAGGIFQLQRDILNRPAYAEALDFSIESLIAGRETAVAAEAVRWMAPVDLIRAAELTQTGGAELWAVVGNELGRALRRWFDLGGAHRECALTAMLATGQPDYADLIWTQLEAGDQEMFRLCQLHEPFHVCVLGTGWATRMSAWSERREALFLSEITSGAGAEEIGYADVRAQKGPPAVRVAALDLLAEHGAFARVLEILLSPEFGEWPLEIYEQVISGIPAALLRLHAEMLRRKFDVTESLSIRARLVDILRRTAHPQWVELAQAELARALATLRAAPLFPMPDRGAPARVGMRVISGYSQMLWRSHSAWMADWLVANFGEQLFAEESFSHHLESFPEDALVALAQRFVAAGARGYRGSAAVEFLLGTGSPRVAAVLIDAYLAAKQNGQEPPDLPRLHETLCQAPVVAQLLVDTILARAATADDYRQLQTLLEPLSPVTALDASLGEQIEVRQRDPLRALIKRVSALIPTDEEARSYRPSLAVMLGSLGTPEDVAVVSAWVVEENVRWEEYRCKVAEADGARPKRKVPHYGTSWWNWYAGGMALFRCPEAETEFFHWLEHPWLPAEGATGLVDLSLMDGSLPRLPDDVFSRRAAAPLARAPNDIKAPVRPRADAIVRAIERLEAVPPEDRSRRIYLPQLAAALARLNDSRAIERLLSLDGAMTGWTPLGALLSMQARGIVLPGRRMARTLEAFIAAHEVCGYSSNDSWYAVVKALKLLLYSDEPTVAIERIRRLPESRMKSYYARDIFALLGESPAQEAATLLLEFSQSAPLRGGAYMELIDALATNSDPRCHARLLELLQVPSEELPGGNTSNLARAILSVAERDGAFRLQLTEAVRKGTVRWSQPPRFGPSIGTAELLDSMLKQADLCLVEQELHQLVDELSETREPAGSPGSYYVFPADATAIKQRLARMLPAGGPNAEVTSRLLAFLRLKRAQRGQPAQEPLHPDASLLETRSVSWPIDLR